jgi:outer membrane receptor protein involved in Fe transport
VWGGYDYQRYGGHDDVLLIARKNETANAVFGSCGSPRSSCRTRTLAAGVRHNFIKTAQDATVWNVSGTYDLSDSLFVRGTAGTSFRLPDAESLFAADPIFNGEIGNPNLKPERARNLNASIGGQMAGISWELIGFYRRTKDLISLDGETSDPDVFTFINLPDTVKATGFEADLTAEPTEYVSLKGSYTHARTRLSGAGRQLAGVPKDTAQAVFDLHPGGQGVWRGRDRQLGRQRLRQRLVGLRAAGARPYCGGRPQRLGRPGRQVRAHRRAAGERLRRGLLHPHQPRDAGCGRELPDPLPRRAADHPRGLFL